MDDRIGLIVRAKEEEAMKNLWLRSMLLGVSLALLLGGAMALAASLSVTIDQACFECWPYEGEQIEPISLSLRRSTS